MEYLGKTPPHSIETEQSLLGTLILDKDAITEVIEIISREDFYKEAHKEIYNAIMELYNKNEPVDIITLAETLTKKGTIDDLGGIDYISKLTEMGVLTTNAKHYAKIIEEKAVLRRIIKLSSTLMEKGYNSQEASELLAIAEKEVFDISQNQNKKGEPLYRKEVTLDVEEKDAKAMQAQLVDPIFEPIVEFEVTNGQLSFIGL